MKDKYNPRKETKDRNKAWRLNNLDKKAKHDKTYYDKNRIAVMSRVSRRLRNNPQARLAHSLRVRLNLALREAGAQKFKKTEELLGCSIQEFKAYIESLFMPGMNWENRRLWHIDHIRPISLFDLTNLEGQKAAMHYKNLQPLWARDNLKKGDRALDEHVSSS